MSKVKEAIKTALEQVNNASHNTYGAKIYTFDQVATILQDIMATADEDNTGGTVLTKAMITHLVGEIEDLITNNIDGISDTDIVEQDSIEMSLSGGRYSVDNIDCDKDLIASEATYNLAQTIYDWAEQNDIEIEP
jgi:hypothetical protein